MRTASGLIAIVLVSGGLLCATPSAWAVGDDALTSSRGINTPIAAVQRSEFYDPLPSPATPVTKVMPKATADAPAVADGDHNGSRRNDADHDGTVSGPDYRRARPSTQGQARGWRDMLPGQLKSP